MDGVWKNIVVHNILFLFTHWDLMKQQYDVMVHITGSGNSLVPKTADFFIIDIIRRYRPNQNQV